jgi:hypothetical protein
MGALVRQALARWIDAGVGVTFSEARDTSDADIIVRWIDRFDIDRAGQTDLTWDQAGRVRRATISLAMRSSAGASLSDPALLSVAVHETGHAIGLPHSADSKRRHVPLDPDSPAFRARRANSATPLSASAWLGKGHQQPIA